MEYKRITRKQSAIARRRAAAIIKSVRALLKGKYTFADRMVGSGALGTMVEADKGKYDLDYQLLLTINSELYNKKTGEFPKPTEIKTAFISAFERSLKDNEIIQNSTTAITLINKDKKPYHIDFVIIKTYPENDQIIRRNNKKETYSKNEFTWNELPEFNDAYDYFRKLNNTERQHLVNDIIIPKKAKEKAKPENDPTKISSSELFIREVNNYRCLKRKK